MSKMADFNCRIFGVVVREDNRILLLKRSEDYIPGTPEHCGWEMIGGGLEHGEQPQEAVEREYLEEAGITIRAGQLFQVRSGMRNDRPLLNIGYVCRYISGDVRLTSEHIDFRWVTPEELARTDLGPYGNADVALYLSGLAG